MVHFISNSPSSSLHRYPKSNLWPMEECLHRSLSSVTKKEQALDLVWVVKKIVPMFIC